MWDMNTFSHSVTRKIGLFAFTVKDMEHFTHEICSFMKALERKIVCTVCHTPIAIHTKMVTIYVHIFLTHLYVCIQLITYFLAKFVLYFSRSSFSIWIITNLPMRDYVANPAYPNCIFRPATIKNSSSDTPSCKNLIPSPQK